MEADGLKIIISSHLPSHYLAKVSGELNGNNTNYFEIMVKDKLFTQPANLHLDFSDLDVFVSAAIGSLLLLNDYVEKSGFEIKLVKSNPKINEILRLVGVDNLLVIPDE